MKEHLHPLREYRVQKFKHAFYHRATCSRFCVKAELTFEPCILLMEGYRILNDIAWYKPNASPNIGCRCFTASHETLIWACKDPKAKHTFNYENMKFSSWRKDFIKKPGKQMRSVWAINKTSASEKTFRTFKPYSSSHYKGRGFGFRSFYGKLQYRNCFLSFSQIFHWH